MDTSILDTIDMRELGKELQQARIKRGLTQEEAARIIAADHTSLAAIEKGEQRIKAGELIKLAHTYGCQVSDFVCSIPQIKSFQVQFRDSAPHDIEDAAKSAAYITMLKELSDNYLQGLITEGQFARILKVERVEARYIAQMLQQHTSDQSR